MKKMLTPADLKAKVNASIVENSYDWEKQTQNDVAKFGTMGTTSQYSPGKMFNDFDSYSD